MPNVTAWECPEGLVVDMWSRFSGCTIGVEVARFLGWYTFLVYIPVILLLFYTVLKLYCHDPAGSPSRVQGMVGMAVGAALAGIEPGYAMSNPRIPATSSIAVAVLSAFGGLCWGYGFFRLLLGHYVASIFQMVSSTQEALLHTLHLSCNQTYHRFTP
jgi:hypothetical protein